MSKPFILPIHQEVLVPSTRAKSKKISSSAFHHRVKEVETFMAHNFGGFTEVNAHGGYVSKKGKLIEEPVGEVTSFATKKAFKTHKNLLHHQLHKWGKKWGQESMGYELNGKLYYYDS